MIWLYYALYGLVTTVFVLASILRQRRLPPHIDEKLGFVSKEITRKAQGKKRIWFHAGALGEFTSSYTFLQLFKEAHPEYEVFISTARRAARLAAQEKASSWATVFSFPYDLPWAIDAWLDCVQPDLVAIFESEAWSGFTYQCSKRGIKLVLLNARLSPELLRILRPLTPVFAPSIQRFELIVAQAESDRDVYLSFGASPQNVHVQGNMRADTVKAIASSATAHLRQELGLEESDVVIVGGSTHDREESALIEALALMKSHVRLILVPRDPERSMRLVREAEERGYRPRLFSKSETFEEEKDICIVDVFGKLAALYSVASIAFVGGSLSASGGHNVLEPCVYAVPVVCGPDARFTRGLADRLLERGALIMVQDKGELARAISSLVESAERRRIAGEAGRQYILDNAGASLRTLKLLESILP